MARRSRPVPVRLRSLRERFEHWRGTRTKKSAIPDDLWAEAEDAAREFGVSCVARVLRLNSDSLKKRVREGRGRGQGHGCSSDGMPRFVDVGLGALSASEWDLEICEGDLKLRAQHRGPSVPDFSLIVEAFQSLRR